MAVLQWLRAAVASLVGVVRHLRGWVGARRCCRRAAPAISLFIPPGEDYVNGRMSGH